MVIKSSKNIKRGGSFLKPLPPPFVGSPWGGKVLHWPGVEAGLSGSRNYYKPNNYNNDTSRLMKLGGRRKRRKSRKFRGGGLIPQDLVNIGNNLMYNTGSAYNAFSGYPAPVNPMPYADQFSRIN